MFDTMTLTKGVSAICGALLIYLFASWAADSLYSTEVEVHAGEVAAQAYTIDTGAAEPAAAADAGPDFAVVLASADPAAGEKVFGKCKACHKIDDTNGVGPHLNGVVNRAKSSVSGFSYSEALLAMAADAWTPENLNGFLKNPKGYMPGTKMSFAGLPKVEDRANVVAYLATLQ